MFFLLGLIIGASVLSWVVIRKKSQHEVPANAYYEVKRGDLLISVLEDGALRAVNEMVIRNALEGFTRIINLAPEGAHVKKGELLVELDASELKDKLNEQELAFQDNLFLFHQAQENLTIQKSLVESRIKDAELKVELAQRDLEKYRDGDAPQQIKVASERLGIMEESVRIAQERFVRTEELHKRGNATKSELEADSLTLKRVRLELEQGQEDLRLIKKFDQPNAIRMLTSNVQQAQDELERLKIRSAAEIAQAEADLKTSQKALGVMESALQQQQKHLENAKIFAPQDGLVVYASVSPFGGRGEGRSDDMRSRLRESGFGSMVESDGRFRRGRGERGGGRSGFGGSGSSGSGGGGGGGGGSGGSFSSSGSTFASASSLFNSANQSSSGGSGGSGASGVGSSSPGGQAGATGSGAGGQGSAFGGGGGVGGAGGAGRSGTSGGSGGSGSFSGGGSQGSSSGSGTEAPSLPSFGSIRQSSSSGFSSFSSSSGSASGQSSGFGSGSSSGSGGFSAAYGMSALSAAYSTDPSQFGSRGGSRSSFSFEPDPFSFGMPSVIEEGAMVRQRQELIRLPDVSRMLAEVKVQEARVRQVHVGMPAFVRVETLPGRRFRGSVRKVGILPDAQASWMNPNLKVYATEILIEDELPELKPGVSARAEIIITNLLNVLSVPIQAVATYKGEQVCFAQKGASAIPVPVTTGWFNDRFIEIKSGLKAGDKVMLAPMSDPDAVESEAPGETNHVESAGRDAQPDRRRPGPPRKE